MECLLKRIIALIPESVKSEGLPKDSILSYIEGVSNTPPDFTEGKEVTQYVSYLFFILLVHENRRRFNLP